MEDGGGCERAGGRASGRAGRGYAASPAPTGFALREARLELGRMARPVPLPQRVASSPPAAPRGSGEVWPTIGYFEGGDGRGSADPPHAEARSPPGFVRMEQPRARLNLNPCLSQPCGSERLTYPQQGDTLTGLEMARWRNHDTWGGVLLFVLSCFTHEVLYRAAPHSFFIGNVLLGLFIRERLRDLLP